MRGRYHGLFMLSVPTYHVRRDTMWWFVCPCHCVRNSISKQLWQAECRRRLEETFLRRALYVPEAQPCLTGEVPWPRPLPELALPCPARPAPLRSGRRSAAARDSRLPPRWFQPRRASGGAGAAARGAPAPRSAVSRGSPPPGSLPVSRGGAVLPPPFPPRLLKKAFFSIVGERKSASSKISEVQVHQIFLLVACYTLRESDCRAPGALLAVRGCSCFPLSRRQKQKWNLLTLSAVPSPVVVAVADLQALWINSKAGNKRSLLAAIISH